MYVFCIIIDRKSPVSSPKREHSTQKTGEPVDRQKIHKNDRQRRQNNLPQLGICISNVHIAPRGILPLSRAFLLLLELLRFGGVHARVRAGDVRGHISKVPRVGSIGRVDVCQRGQSEWIAHIHRPDGYRIEETAKVSVHEYVHLLQQGYLNEELVLDTAPTGGVPLSDSSSSFGNGLRFQAINYCGVAAATVTKHLEALNAMPDDVKLFDHPTFVIFYSQTPGEGTGNCDAAQTETFARDAFNAIYGEDCPGMESTPMIWEANENHVVAEGEAEFWRPTCTLLRIRLSTERRIGSKRSRTERRTASFRVTIRIFTCTLEVPKTLMT